MTKAPSILQILMLGNAEFSVSSKSFTLSLFHISTGSKIQNGDADCLSKEGSAQRPQEFFSSFFTLAHYRGLDILWSKRWLKTPSIKLCFLFVSASSVTFIGLSLLRLYWIWRSIIGIESISLSSLHLPLCFVDKCVPQLLIWYDGYYWHVWITRFEFGSFTAHMCIPCILCISLVCLGWDGEQT